MWQLLLFAVFSISVLGSVYVAARFHRLDFVRAVSRRSRLLGWLLCLLPLLVSACFLTVNTFTAAVVLLHFVIIWALSDLIGFIVRKCARHGFRRYYAGMAALCVTVLWLGAGWFCAHHVFLTRYTFASPKIAAPARVALIADAHLGITLDGPGLARQLDRLRAEQPDALLVAGDFVDDDTSREDMLAGCAALGDFGAPVYFVYGNHDRGYFGYRDFTPDELRDALLRSGVHILEDAGEALGDSLYILGRRDRSVRGRADIASLAAGADPGQYILVLDHQPNDYAAEAAAGVDLVLSGHTHGGHLFPAGQAGLLMGANDRRYGSETRGSTAFVVTSGISGWAIPFKTACWSEAVIIDLVPAAN